MQELVDAAAEHLGERVRLGTKVTEVRREKESVRVRAADGSSEVADAVVLALPSYIAASLFASGDPLTARAFESIPYAPIAVACLGFRREAVGHALDGYGFLVPRDQGLRILGCIFVSTLFPEHAPEGTVNLRCLLGGARDPDILNSSDENLLDIVREELRPILGLQGMPDPVRIFRYGRGIPQYNLGHSDRIDRLERRLWDLPGVFIAGNAYHGIGLNDCVRMGKRKARAMREYLRR
jgi:oxygen-dependent protoporphyrinogen oxidase